jgi:hypothetical protein
MEDDMRTEVTVKKIVTVGMTLEEWIDALANPEPFLIAIENAALAVVETNGNKPKAKASKRPKSGKVIRRQHARKIKKTANFYECPQCAKKFSKQAWLTKHIERVHAAEPAEH